MDKQDAKTICTIRSSFFNMPDIFSWLYTKKKKVAMEIFISIPRCMRLSSSLRSCNLFKENKVDKTFTWVIKNLPFSSRIQEIVSDAFVMGGCRWFLIAFKGSKAGYLSLCLVVADPKSLPPGWRRHAKFSIKVVNQFHEILSLRQASTQCFNEYGTGSGFLLPITKIEAKHGGYMVNGAVKIVAEIDVIQVIGRLDVTKPLNDDSAASKETLADWVDVHGFQLLPSQVESVKRIFERYPNIASQVRPKNRHLKSTYMNVLLGLIETLRHLPEELSADDLNEASVAVSYVEKGGFKLDWLKKKLEEVKEKKNSVDTATAWLQQLEEDLQKYSQKCFYLKALIDEGNAYVSAANVPLSFDDLV